MKSLFFIFITIFVVFNNATFANDADKLKLEIQKKIKEEIEKRKTVKSKGQQTGLQTGLPQEKPSLVCNASLKAKICYAFTGPNNSAKNKIKGNEMACKLLRGTMIKESTCPNERVLGKCQIQANTADEFFLFYYSGGKINSSGAQKDCLDAKSGLHRAGAGTWQKL